MRRRPEPLAPRPGRAARGFSLVEVLVVLALISLAAGAVAPMALRQLTGNRQSATLEKMKQIVAGMAGDPRADGDYGYVGDMGGLPASLADLNARGTQNPYAIDPTWGIGSGYNGPYVPHAGPASAAFVDAWNTPFQYAAAAQLTSAGPDRSFGSGDDLVYPATAPVLTGNVSVDVLGVPNDGGPAVALTSAEASVFLASSVDGVRIESALAGAGPFTTPAPVPAGYHGLRVTGNGAWAGAVALEVIEVRRGTLAVDVALEQPPGGAPPGGGPPGVGPPVGVPPGVGPGGGGPPGQIDPPEGKPEKPKKPKKPKKDG